MSEKRRDSQGRWRSKMIAFRVSPEEDALIETVIRMLGVTKQEYLTSNMLKHALKITPSPRMFKGLKDSIKTLIKELQRIEAGKNVDSDLLFTINTALDIYRQCMKISRS